MTTAPTLSPAAALRRPAVRGWLLACSVYFLAVFHRSSLGVSGLLAERRFGIDASQLGVFVLLQIGVYAAMQIPTGVLVDRYGPRRLLVAAAGLMGIGQLTFALAPSYPVALFARALLGCGDAMTFVSVLRFAAGRFGPRRYPVLVALTATIGTAGNVLATVPFELLLTRVGWTPAFGVVAVASLAAAVAVWLLLDDRSLPPRRLHDAHEVRVGVAAVSRRVTAAWSLAGTRLGFWVHFACMATATPLLVLWGHPYLVDGAGFSPAGASIVLLVGVLVSAVAGPCVGWVIGHHPNLRVGMGLVICGATVLGWSATLLALGDHPAQWWIAALFVLTMFGPPASMVAFAVARDYNSDRIVGTASGTVNVGGFLATSVVALVFGMVLTTAGGTSPHHLRYAMAVPLVVQVFGMTRVIAWVRRVRALIAGRQADGKDNPVAVSRHFWWDGSWAVAAAAADEQLITVGSGAPTTSVSTTSASSR